MKAPWWIVPLLGFLLAAFGSGAIFYFAIRPQQDQIRQLEEKNPTGRSRYRPAGTSGEGP
jgi:hypothetical protein